MKRAGNDKDRGRIEHVRLRKAFTLNSNVITDAVIEIDHINYGLDKKTKKLNKRKRTNFSVIDVERFLALLDGEYLLAASYRQKVSRFNIRIDCPVHGRFYGKQFVMIFELDHDKSSEIYTVTLFPGW